MMCWFYVSIGQITLRQRNTSETAQEVTIDVIENQSVTFACATFPTINVRPPGSSTFGTNILDIVPNLIARGELTTGLFTFEFQNVTQSDNGTEFQCRGAQGFTDIGVIIVSCKLLQLCMMSCVVSVY